MTTNQMATVTIRDVAWKLARGGHVPIECKAFFAQQNLGRTVGM